MKVVSWSSISSPSSWTDLGLTLYLLSLILCLLVLFIWMTSSRSWTRELGRKVRHPTPCSIIVIDMTSVIWTWWRDQKYSGRLSIRNGLFTPFSKYIFCLHASNLQFFLLVPKSMLEFDKKNYLHNQQFLLKGPWQLTYIKLSVTPHNTEKIRPKQDPQHILRVCYRIWGMRNGRLSFVGCIWDHHLSNQNSFGGS